MKVISLGWGVQSFALAAMSALDVLPKVDVAIHADTTFERSGTYEFAAKWTPWLEERGVKVVTVENQTYFPRGDGVFIPAYTVNYTTRERGMLWRVCTERWKIRNIRRWLQAHRNGDDVEIWIGYTLDEAERAKSSDVNYATNRFPFLEMESPMSRWEVQKWLKDNSLDIPPKSGCVFCPYHGAAVWQEVRKHSRDWNRALAVDSAIRLKRPGYNSYLTTECRRLQECSFSNQLSLWNEECEGYCFL